MIKYGGLSFETQLKIEFLTPNNGSKKIFFNWDSLHARLATTRHGVTRKRSPKRLNHTGNLFRKNLQLKDVC